MTSNNHETQTVSNPLISHEGNFPHFQLSKCISVSRPDFKNIHIFQHCKELLLLSFLSVFLFFFFHQKEYNDIHIQCVNSFTSNKVEKKIYSLMTKNDV